MTKAIVIDLESTGLDCWRNEMLTISASILDDLKVVDEIELSFRPDDFQTWTQAAEKIHGISIVDAMSFPNQYDQTIELGKFISQVKKPVPFVCHARGSTKWFDTMFLQAHFTKHNLLYRYRKYFKETISTINLMKHHAGRFGYMENRYALNMICEFFGIELDHHNATSDRKACEQIYIKCMES